MCVFSSHSFWTSGLLDVPAGVTQEKGHTGFFINLLSAVRNVSREPTININRGTKIFVNFLTAIKYVRK